MKVTLVNSLYFPHHVGGAEISVQTIAEGLAARGCDVSVLTLAGPAGPSEIEHNSVRVLRMPLDNFYWPFGHHKRAWWKRLAWHAIDSLNPAAALRVAHAIDRLRPDVLQTHNLSGFSPTIWLVGRAMGVPLVHTLHDYSLLCPRATMMLRGVACDGQCQSCSFARLPHKMASTCVDAVVSVSESVLKTHTTAGFLESATFRSVIHNGYDIPEIPFGRNVSSRSTNGSMRVGFIGSIAPHKGVGVLLASAEMLPAHSLTISVAGSGDAAYVARLKSNARSNIKFVGKVKPHEYLRELDVLVVPSIWAEPFGRVVIEAYAHGVPVIGSDSGGITELIQHSRTGLLVPPGNTRALAEALKLLVDQPTLRMRMGGAAREYASRFATGRMISAYEQVHSKLLGGDLCSGAPLASLRGKSPPRIETSP